MAMTQDIGYEAARANQKAFERKCSIIAVLVMVAVACLVLVL
jgi:hypothetical protein